MARLEEKSSSTPSILRGSRRSRHHAGDGVRRYRSPPIAKGVGRQVRGERADLLIEVDGAIEDLSRLPRHSRRDRAQTARFRAWPISAPFAEPERAPSRRARAVGWRGRRARCGSYGGRPPGRTSGRVQPRPRSTLFGPNSLQARGAARLRSVDVYRGAAHRTGREPPSSASGSSSAGSFVFFLSPLFSSCSGKTLGLAGIFGGAWFDRRCGDPHSRLWSR